MKEVFKGFADKIKAFFADRKKRAGFIAVTATVAVLLVSVIFCAVYVNDYYHADEEAIEAFSENSKVTPRELDDGILVFEPRVNKTQSGLIFYPGGKIEYTAYAPLMHRLADLGILTVLVEMPCNLAVLDMNAADGITAYFPGIKNWYIGGHSLGGSMAASYLAKNSDEIDGLILLGSYSTADVTDSRVLSIYGSEDKVMNREKYEKYKGNLPEDFTEIVIEGGNHAYFGMYGQQDGDGESSMTAAAQIKLTALHILAFIGSK